MERDEFWSITNRVKWPRVESAAGRAKLRELLLTPARAREFLWHHHECCGELEAAIGWRLGTLSEPGDRQALLDHFVGLGHVPYLLTIFDHKRASDLAQSRAWSNYRGDILVEAYLMARGTELPPP
jgi:hypothetical protein